MVFIKVSILVLALAAFASAGHSPQYHTHVDFKLNENQQHQHLHQHQHQQLHQHQQHQHLHQHQHGYESTGQAVSSQKIVQDFTPSHEGHYDLGDIHSHDLGHHNYENAHPKYKFEYSVDDPQTEDQKSHWESRDGDVVEGQYSLKQSDGKTRTVTYKADKENGFQAEVNLSGDENQAYHGHHHLHAQAFDDLSHYHHHY